MHSNWLGQTHMTKIKWKVAEKETGRYASFHRRSWPTAYYNNGAVAASILCETEYIPSQMKTGNHSPLTLMIADYSFYPYKWARLKTSFATLQELKDAFQKFIDAHPKVKGVNK